MYLILYCLTLFCAAVFVVFMMLRVIYWFVFFPALKRLDPERHETIRFKWREPYPRAYARFIFDRKYLTHDRPRIVVLAERLYWYGQIGQWAFNLSIVFWLLLIFLS